MPKLGSEYWFSAAHRLSKGYKGKCTRLHGHNYQVVVVLNGYDLNEVGMVTDFHDLDAAFKAVEDRFDHALLLWDGDPILTAGLEVLSNEFHFPIVRLTDNPTVEVLAREILQMLRDRLCESLNCFVESVRVWENKDSWAEVA